MPVTLSDRIDAGSSGTAEYSGRRVGAGSVSGRGLQASACPEESRLSSSFPLERGSFQLLGL